MFIFATMLHFGNKILNDTTNISGLEKLYCKQLKNKPDKGFYPTVVSSISRQKQH